MTRASALAARAVVQPGLFDPPGTTPVTPLSTHRVPVRAHRRTVVGEAPPSGRQRRDAALRAHAGDSSLAEVRAYVRAQLTALYRQRTVAWAHKPERICVNADDVAEILEAWADCPPDIRSRPGHWKGSLFAGREWEKTGTSVTSSRPHMHATLLPNWRLAE
jgi:hypothetical protein